MTQPIPVSLPVPNLAVLGTPRQVGPPEADLITIWRTPYPVLKRYILLCGDMGVKPFAGGTYKRQGAGHEVGFITSGYRNKIIAGSKNSPHLFALAIDIAVGDIHQQIKWARKAQQHFYRIGLYPENGIIHVDLCNQTWQRRHGAPASWVRLGKKYHHKEGLEQSIQFALAAV